MAVQSIKLQSRCLSSPRQFKVDNLILPGGDLSVTNTANNKPTAMEIATYSICWLQIFQAFYFSQNSGQNWRRCINTQSMKAKSTGSLEINKLGQCVWRHLSSPMLKEVGKYTQGRHFQQYAFSSVCWSQSFLIKRPLSKVPGCCVCPRKYS